VFVEQSPKLTATVKNRNVTEFYQHQTAYTNWAPTKLSCNSVGITITQTLWVWRSLKLLRR